MPPATGEPIWRASKYLLPDGEVIAGEVIAERPAQSLRRRGERPKGRKVSRPPLGAPDSLGGPGVPPPGWSSGQNLLVVGQRGLGIRAEIGEPRGRVDRLLDFAVALHFELHAAGHDPEGRLFVESRLERHFHVNIPFLVLDPAGYAFALQIPELAFDELLVELLLVLKGPGQVRRPAAVNRYGALHGFVIELGPPADDVLRGVLPLLQVLFGDEQLADQDLLGA